MVVNPRERSHWWNRHPGAAIVLINVFLLLLVLAGAEVFLRWYLPLDPGYYTAFEERPGVYRYPFGFLKYNSAGFPDDEFDLATTRPRVGYFGDSVTRGVGVGYGYRISDLLESAYPAYEHWTFGTVREGVDERGAKKILDLAKTYDLDIVVYLLNLNDILPSRRFARSGEASWIARAKEKLEWLDALRGRSYLYSVIRTQVRLFLATRGYGYQGWKAAELFPTANARAIRETAERIIDLAEELERRGVAFVTILLPYEMQVSAEAAQKYSEIGVRWDVGFLEGLTQQMLIDQFTGRVRYFDARLAFAGGGVASLPSPEHGLGQYFVYNRGDAIDWNHPNREGDRRIATWLAQQEIFPALLGKDVSHAEGPGGEADGR
jgi:lysophospholipase L1-like esterase